MHFKRRIKHRGHIESQCGDTSLGEVHHSERTYCTGKDCDKDQGLVDLMRPQQFGSTYTSNIHIHILHVIAT